MKRKIISILMTTLFIGALTGCSLAPDKREKEGTTINWDNFSTELSTKQHENETEQSQENVELETQEESISENVVQEQNEINTDQLSNEQTSPSQTATISGDIKSIGNGSFSILKAEVYDNVMVSSDSNEIINVVYTNNTEITICTTLDAGITVSYSSGTTANLVLDKLVEIEGAYVGDDFVATKIIVYRFE
jgi:hypothetical protein